MKIYKIAENIEDLSEDEFVDYHRTGYIDSDSYQSYKDVEGMSWLKKENYTVLHATKQFGDKTIEFRMSGKKNKYTHFNEETMEHKRDPNGELIYKTDEEVLAQGSQLYEVSIVAFDGDNAIGLASDEWGTDGIWVVDDYQKMGIGVYLLTELRKNFPKDRKMGQMTDAGSQLARSYYRNLNNEDI